MTTDITDDLFADDIAATLANDITVEVTDIAATLANDITVEVTDDAGTARLTPAAQKNVASGATSGPGTPICGRCHESKEPTRINSRLCRACSGPRAESEHRRAITIPVGLHRAFVAACKADDVTPAHAVESLIHAWLDGRASPSPENTGWIEWDKQERHTARVWLAAFKVRDMEARAAFDAKFRASYPDVDLPPLPPKGDHAGLQAWMHVVHRQALTERPAYYPEPPRYQG